MPERRTASKRLVFDGRVLAEMDETRENLRLAKLAESRNPQGLTSPVPRLERQLVELAERAADESLLVVVQAIPGDDFDDLRRRHPPTDEQLERYKRQAQAVPWAEMPEMNPASMGPELLAVSLVEPDWDEAKVRAFWSELSKGQQNELWNLALGVQIQGSDLPFYAAATATTDGGGEPSTMSATRESPSPDS